MAKTESKTEYVSISLPKVLIAQVEAVVEPHGYASRVEVVKDAIRQLLDKLKGGK